ncbi:hypothetical protein Scep_000792 [Stephania cephalantha]|uniref:Uncharacterized protein n=1 Tax=Stephania cephalantha TaxID=152367 RepID=A0AAP0L7A8_9MAGN
MGAQFSKKASNSPPPPMQINAELEYTAELSSYEDACKRDPDLQSFDSSLQARTNRAISTLAGGVEVQALSFDSLKEVTECLLEMNQEVVKIILACKKDIWKNQELFELVEEYFENSLQTLDFCTALEKCLKKARDSQLIIHVALQQFEEEDVEGGDKKYFRTLEELRNFKEAGDPFTEDFFKHSDRGEGVEEGYVLHFAAAFAAFLICSVVAAVIAAPPVASALAAATSIPLGSMGKWFDSLWKNYEKALKGQKEVVSSMQAGAFIAIMDLDTIRVHVDRLRIEIESLLQTAEFAFRQDEAVRFAIEEIKKRLGVFMQSIEDLGEHADRCSRDIRKARTVVLQRIIKLPNK